MWSIPQGISHSSSEISIGITIAVVACLVLDLLLRIIAQRFRFL